MTETKGPLDTSRGTRTYWEMADAERAAIDPELVGEDEAFVLWKINHGRRLVASEYQAPADLYPRQMVPHVRSVEDCNYYDAIAALLIAGAHDGMDSAKLCEDALHQQRSLMDDGRAEALDIRGFHGPEAPRSAP